MIISSTIVHFVDNRRRGTNHGEPWLGGVSSQAPNNPVNRPRGALGIAARCVGWMAPSICVFAVSASLAYAMTLAVGGGPSAQDGDRGVYAGVASAQISATTALVYDEADGTPCETGACARIRRLGPATGETASPSVSGSSTLV